ncbi:MAG: hypothetical protein HWD59_09885 [Coxiellaceae bacterium]|nr:MAG: hypothetical protein HWD59_09885 [Coxiellaceae bacterium]
MKPSKNLLISTTACRYNFITNIKNIRRKTFTDNENQHTFIFSQQFYTELVLLCETAPQHYQTVANGLLEKLTFISIVESATADDHLNLILRTIKLLCKSTNQKINIPIEPIFHVIKKGTQLVRYRQ